MLRLQMLLRHTGVVFTYVQWKGKSGRRIRSASRKAASLPSSTLGMCAVDSGGSTTAASCEPSKPETITSAGMRSPFLFSAVIK